MEDGGFVGCPYCGESLWIAFDPSGGARQRFISDCEICCRPIELRLSLAADGTLHVDARTDEDNL